MKKIILIITILATTGIYSQNSDIIEITTSASGITKEVAIQDALRSALEQSYGSFISTKTNIKNDELLKDEIVAITSGEIHDYEVVSETKIESGYAVTIVAKISKSVLNNFVTLLTEIVVAFLLKVKNPILFNGVLYSSFSFFR